MQATADLEIDDLAGVLLPENGGREAANKMLVWIREQSEARCVSLWSASSELRLLLSASLDHEGFAGAERAWREQQRILGEGPPVQSGTQMIVSIEVDGAPYLMALEDVKASRLSVDTLTRYARVATRAMLAARSGGPAGPGGPRATLVALLEREQWVKSTEARRRPMSRTDAFKAITRFGRPKAGARR
jgi:hypothetical protein